MKRNLLLSVLLLLAALTSGSAFAADGEGFVPAWQVGDRWVLEASYRDLKSEGDVWLPPVNWVFKVRARKELNGQECYVLHVYARGGEVKNQAVLYLATADLRPVRVLDIFPTAEGMKYSERDVDPNSSEPLVAEDTVVPYDLPAFPITRANNAVQGADGFSAYRGQSLAKKFAKIRNIGGLSFKRTVAQKNKAPDKQHADTFAAYRSRGATYQVEIEESRAGTNLTQLWQQGSPWAVSSENRERKVRLVPPSAPTPLPEAGRNNGGEY